MYIAPRWINRKLTSLELAISLILIAGFIGVFSHHGLVIFATAERAMLNTTVVNIKTALKHRAMLSRLQHGGSISEDLTDLNPMTNMQAADQSVIGNVNNEDASLAALSYAVVDTPYNYIGELSGPVPDRMEKGIWYFDRINRVLVYTIRNTEFFVTELPGQARVRFKIKVAYSDRNDDGQFTPDVDKLQSVSFFSPDHYEWRI